MLEQALEGVTIIDLSHYIAGSYCTKLLGGLGAEVIKIEKPGEGDGLRRIGPFYQDSPHIEHSLPFLYLNDNKKSITLNLKTEMGGKIFRELVERADVVVENFKPGKMKNIGLDYELLSKLNRGLVMTSISNFGQTGPYRDYKAYEINLEALGGMMYGEGEYGREPVKFGTSLAQFIAGVVAAGSTVTSLYNAAITNKGEHLDVSIQESLLQFIFWPLVSYTYTGGIKRRSLKKFPAEGITVLPMKDGSYFSPLFVGYIDMDLIAALLEELELVEPRFSSYSERAKHADELESILRRALARHGKELFHTAQELGIGFGLVQDIEDIVKSPQLESRSYFTSLNHPKIGKAIYPGAPFKATRTPWQTPRPAPLLGEHNEEIYSTTLGFSRGELTKLKANGII